MLCRASEVNGYRLGARDGEFGSVGDFDFDDRSWTVQYLVAHTGSWLSDRLVLIPSGVLHPPNHEERRIAVDLTKDEIEHAAAPYIGPSSRQPAHLRSMWAMTTCHIHAVDGAIGHVEDFVIDDTLWAIRYLIVDTRNWWVGKRVLLFAPWVEHVNWTDSKVAVGLHRETIQQAPEYVADAPVTRDYETALFRHYQRDPYWQP